MTLSNKQCVVSRIARTKWSPTTALAGTLKQERSRRLFHGEGRLLAPEETAKNFLPMAVAHHVDLNGEPSLDAPWNPNGSSYAIEGLLSPWEDLGKMVMRTPSQVCAKIPGMKEQKIFENAVQWVKHHKAQVSHEA